MTQNLQPFFGTGNINPLNIYKPNQIPFESLQFSHGEQQVETDFDEFVRHVNKHRNKSGLSQKPESDIKEQLLKHTRNMGIDDAEGAGFWGDVWNGIKNVGKVALKGVDSAVQKVASDPMGTIGTLAPLLMV